MIYSSWFIHALILFFGTFLHEDVAIVTAEFFVVEEGLSIAVALISIYTGVVASDVFIYGLGTLARHIPRAQQLLINDSVIRVLERLNRNLVWSVAMCRFLPGLLFSTFVACGWMRVSFFRFALTSMISAAVYTPIMLLLVVNVGEVVVKQIGKWAWLVVLGIVLVLVLRAILRSSRSEIATEHAPARNLYVADNETSGRGVSLADQGLVEPHVIWRKVSFAERLPDILFYTPVTLRWLALGLRYHSLTLPTVANPNIDTGGLWGESKSQLMNSVGIEAKQWLASFITLTRNDSGVPVDSDLAQALHRMQDAGLEFPVVVKPDVSWQGYGVRLLHDEEELRNYLAIYPVGEVLILQQPVDFDGEAGVFYVRLPGESNGRIESLTFRYIPQVIGDGKTALRELIWRDVRTRFKMRFYLGKTQQHKGVARGDLNRVPDQGERVRLTFIGSIRVGGLYRDASRFITPDLNRCFDVIGKSLPEFYFGRFDVRFKSIENLQAAKDFSVIEINGAGSEPIHVWDPEYSLVQSYKELFRFQSLMFEISRRNRARGYRPMPLMELYRRTRNYQKLLKKYPASS